VVCPGTAGAMSLERIRGQDHAVGLLRSAYDSGRLPHAYLFQGPEGVGKETTALEFAAALNCEAGGLAGCGECPACRMAAGLSHPDIHLVFPVPRTLKPEELSEILGAAVRDGYRETDFGRRAAIISVEIVLSEVVARANQRPYVGPWKVFVVADADTMTTEAANTLLKTLEEPPDATVIILTTSRPSALPSTVVSRCQRVPFTRLDGETIEEILVSDPRLGFDRKAARAAAAAAGGSAGRAVRTDMKSLNAELDRVASIMIGKRAGTVKSLLDEAGALAFRLGREEQERVLDLMLLWFRDVLLVSCLGDGARPELTYRRHGDEVKREAELLSFDVVDPLISRIDGARRAIERYSNPTIVFTSVLLDLAIARRRAAGGRARPDAGKV
jgi:DNA polymerase-3 subunit delta'